MRIRSTSKSAISLSTVDHARECLKRRSVLCFVDNAVALHGFVKGTSVNVAIGRASHLLHLLTFICECHVWFEWVGTDYNWSDGISRGLE